MLVSSAEEEAKRGPGWLKDPQCHLQGGTTDNAPQLCQLMGLECALEAPLILDGVCVFEFLNCQGLGFGISLCSNTAASGTMFCFQFLTYKGKYPPLTL